MQETWVRSLGWEDILEKEKAIHFIYHSGLNKFPLNQKVIIITMMMMKGNGRGNGKGIGGESRGGNGKEEKEKEVWKETHKEKETEKKAMKQREKPSQKVNRTEVIRRMRQMVRIFWTGSGGWGWGERKGHLITYPSYLQGRNSLLIWELKESRTDLVRLFPLVLVYLRGCKFGTARYTYSPVLYLLLYTVNSSIYPPFHSCNEWPSETRTVFWA